MVKILSSLKKNACVVFLALLAKSTVVSGTPTGSHNPGIVIQKPGRNYDNERSANGYVPSKSEKQTGVETVKWKQIFSEFSNPSEFYYSYINFIPVKSPVLFQLHLRI